MDLATFRAEVLNDVQIRVAADGGFTDYAFMAVAAARLEDANEVANFEACHYRAPSGKSRIDGYAFDAADDSLRLFLVHRSSDDQLETVTQTEVRVLFKRLTSFLEAAFSGRFEQSIDDNHPARDFAETIGETKASLSRIRAYLVTDCILSSRVKDWPEGHIESVPIEYHIWDIGRFYRAHMSNSGLDEVVVDFRDGFSEGLPCLEASIADSPYASYLCVVPASLLAKIYDTYGSRLLEGNVRAFLSAKGKVNQGIRKTLLERPEMFFAYNNGIAGVAREVTIEQTPSGPRLVSATNLQIVNGGQTTASIANVGRVDKAPHLGSTFVPMKLSVVDGEQAVAMIGDISRFANSQNKVSDADFFANHPFHQRLEQISRRVLAPARPGMQYETRWYYERARGQYLNEFAKLTAAQRERSKHEIPKAQIITKTDLAKSELSWQQRPHIVSQGAQNFFHAFAERVDGAWKADSDAFHEEYFRDAVSRVLVCRTAEYLVSRQSWYYSGYRGIIVTYTIAKIARDIERAGDGIVDLKRLWRQQELYDEFRELLISVASNIFDALNALPENQKNLTQWAKRQSCWEQIQKLPPMLTAPFLGSLVDSSESSNHARTARAMQQVDSGIDHQASVLTLGNAFWQSVLDWAETRGTLATSDRKALSIAAGHTPTLPTDKQSKRLLDLKKRFEDAGFTTALGTLAPAPWRGL